MHLGSADVDILPNVYLCLHHEDNSFHTEQAAFRAVGDEYRLLGSTRKLVSQPLEGKNIDLCLAISLAHSYIPYYCGRQPQGTIISTVNGT